MLLTNGSNESIWQKLAEKQKNYWHKKAASSQSFCRALRGGTNRICSSSWKHCCWMGDGLPTAGNALLTQWIVCKPCKRFRKKWWSNGAEIGRKCRMTSAEKMRQQMKDTWQEMGVDERRQTKKQIKEAMRQMPFPGHRGMFGNRPFGPFGPFDNSEANDPRYTG